MAKGLNYQKLNDYRKTHIGGAVLGGPDPYQETIAKVTKTLVGKDRRRVEINALQRNKNRNVNQEKRLQCLLKLEVK